MAKTYGETFPERALMSTISDLLGVPHFTTSRGGTVRSDFLQAMAEALEVDGIADMRKDDLIRACWEAATGEEMPDSKLSRGGTVTNIVLQDIVNGIIERKVSGNVATVPDDPTDGTGSGEESDEFNTGELIDERKKRIREIAEREGQNKFRAAVLESYGNRCAVTGSDVPAAIEAAHILPYRGPKYNQIANGLSLRRDIHRLFDLGMVAIDEDALKVLIGPSLKNSDYAWLDGVELTVPHKKSDRPSRDALRLHRLSTELGAAE